MILELNVFLFCFFGDGHPFNDQCFDARFAVDTVIECRTAGGSTPLNINTGINNPGNGSVAGYSTFMGERTLEWATNFESRGFSSHPVARVGYTVGNGDLIFSWEGQEECDCFTRIPGGCDQ